MITPQTIFLYVLWTALLTRALMIGALLDLLPPFAAIWPPLHPLARHCLAAISKAEAWVSSDHLLPLLMEGTL